MVHSLFTGVNGLLPVGFRRRLPRLRRLRLRRLAVLHPRRLPPQRRTDLLHPHLLMRRPLLTLPRRPLPLGQLPERHHQIAPVQRLRTVLTKITERGAPEERRRHVLPLVRRIVLPPITAHHRETAHRRPT